MPCARPIPAASDRVGQAADEDGAGDETARDEADELAADEGAPDDAAAEAEAGTAAEDEAEGTVGGDAGPAPEVHPVAAPATAATDTRPAAQ